MQASERVSLGVKAQARAWRRRGRAEAEARLLSSGSVLLRARTDENAEDDAAGKQPR
jgi:hypothetical protein